MIQLLSFNSFKLVGRRTLQVVSMDNNINGDVEDNGSDLLAEEFAKLQRQYMLMESNKKAYTEEMGSHLAKQK